MLVQTDDRSCVRDTTNHALLTTDTHALQRARARRAAHTKTQALQGEVDKLNTQVIQLSSLVEQLLRERTNG